jgi:hypothetical protein
LFPMAAQRAPSRAVRAHREGGTRCMPPSERLTSGQLNGHSGPNFPEWTKSSAGCYTARFWHLKRFIRPHPSHESRPLDPCWASPRPGEAVYPAEFGGQSESMPLTRTRQLPPGPSLPGPSLPGPSCPVPPARVPPLSAPAPSRRSRINGTLSRPGPARWSIEPARPGQLAAVRRHLCPRGHRDHSGCGPAVIVDRNSAGVDVHDDDEMSFKVTKGIKRARVKPSLLRKGASS